jgi:hypothetical protein
MPELLALFLPISELFRRDLDTVEMETSSSFAICLRYFHNCIIANLFIRNKDRFCFINGNLNQKYVDKQESFQHYYVFVTQLSLSRC